MNMQNLMAQAKKIQKEIEQAQEEIDNTIYEGKSEWVVVTMSGKREINSCNINKDSLNDPEDIEMLQDMIIIAMNDALKKIDDDTDKKLSKYGSGLNGLM